MVSLDRDVQGILGLTVWTLLLTAVDEGAINQEAMLAVADLLHPKVGGGHRRRRNNGSSDGAEWRSILCDWHSEEMYEMKQEEAIQKLIETFRNPTVRLQSLAHKLQQSMLPKSSKESVPSSKETEISPLLEPVSTNTGPRGQNKQDSGEREDDEGLPASLPPCPPSSPATPRPRAPSVAITSSSPGTADTTPLSHFASTINRDSRGALTRVVQFLRLHWRFILPCALLALTTLTAVCLYAYKGSKTTNNKSSLCSVRAGGNSTHPLQGWYPDPSNCPCPLAAASLPDLRVKLSGHVAAAFLDLIIVGGGTDQWDHDAQEVNNEKHIALPLSRLVLI